MEICCLTGFDAAQADFGALTTANKQLYAMLHLYQFRCWRTPVPGRTGHWMKIAAMLHLWEEFEYIFWTDADVMIVDLQRNLDLTLLLGGLDLLIGRDQNGPCVGWMLARTSQRLKMVFMEALELGDEANFHGWHDQHRLLQVLGRRDATWAALERPRMLSFPNTYERGDFSIHWAGDWKDQLRDLLGVGAVPKGGIVTVVDSRQSDNPGQTHIEIV